jgi:hypothetical protein
MNKPLRYRTGNQPEEFEICETYLGWKPVGFKDWYHAFTEEDGINRRRTPLTLTLASPDDSQTVSIIAHQPLSKDAFPMDIFSEARAENWWSFAIISLEEKPAERFIIPLH